MGKKRKYSRGSKGTLTSGELQQTVRRLFKRHPKKRMDAKMAARKLKSKNSKDAIEDAIQQLVKRGTLEAAGYGKYRYRVDEIRHGDQPVLEGVVDMTRSGSAYIVSASMEKDVYVSSRKLGGALHGDTVRVAWYNRRGKPEGEIIEILTRKHTHFLGTLQKDHNFWVVIPDDEKVQLAIYIAPDAIKEAKAGEKVVAEVTQWPNAKFKHPLGVITTVLGAAGSNDIEMKSILIQQGFELDFPKEVLEENDAIRGDFPADEIARRRDMRGITTFTIDPATAKDFDDALSIQVLENGNYEVGVHIADVAYYVQEGSALDVEAAKRTTSVYLVDRVLPMLPEKLSNGVCSLRPNEDKFTFSAVFEMTPKGEVVGEWFGRTVTHSDRRFTYEEAQEILDAGAGEYYEELNTLNRFAHYLRKVRFKKGSIHFDSKEVRFKLDAAGKPLEVFVKARKDTHMLVEDFMLLANRRVAAKMYHKPGDKESTIPFVYRIHDTPDLDKVAEFARFAKEFGYQIDFNSPERIAKSFNAMLEKAKGRPEWDVLQQLGIRTMAKAAYSTDNIGHYGLGFETYTHFTSPIRRYADVLVHRILAQNLDGQTTRVNAFKLEEQCKHISQQERKAIDAERESIKYKQVEYMQDHVGEVFEGVISGMMSRGVFVELLDNHCEGMISGDSMSSYIIDAEQLRLTHKHNGSIRKYGDKVRVRIVKTDLARRRIEMELTESQPEVVFGKK